MIQSCFQYNLLYFLAPLTEEEVAAIDAAGAKGPSATLPRRSCSVKERVQPKSLWAVWFKFLTTFVALLLVYFLVSCQLGWMRLVDYLTISTKNFKFGQILGLAGSDVLRSLIDIYN